MQKIILLLIVCIIYTVIAKKAATPAVVPVKEEKLSKTVAAAVKDTTFNGVGGLNIEVSAPFKFKEYIVGFNYNVVGNLQNAPKSFFAKKSFSTGGEGEATVEAEYNVAAKTIKLATKWASEKLGFSVNVAGDSDDKVTTVGASTTQTVGGNKLLVTADYDVQEKKLSGSSKLTVDDTDVSIAYDNVDKEPILAISHKLNSQNTLEPSVSLKDGSMKYGWLRKWSGGSVESTLTPGDKLTVEWKDNGANGVWSTRAEIPVHNQANSKVSFAREWTC